MIYFISDHHWGHANVIRMSNRPFTNVHEMDQVMLDRWNETVGEDDEVYYLGDLSYKMNPKAFISQVLNNLNGKIYLIPGNHDRRNLNKYAKVIDILEERVYIQHVYEENTYKFVLDHYPLFSWDGMWRKAIHLHGHTHYNTDDLVYSTIGHKKNVNCEFLDYRPISIVDIINEFKDKDLNII